MRPGIDLGHQSQAELGGRPHLAPQPMCSQRRSSAGAVHLAGRSRMQALTSRSTKAPNARKATSECARIEDRHLHAIKGAGSRMRQIPRTPAAFRRRMSGDVCRTSSGRRGCYREDREVAQGDVREGRMPLARARRADAQQRSRQAIDEPASPVMIVDQLRRLHRRSRLRSASAARPRGHWAHRSGDAGRQEHGRGGIGLPEWYRDFS